MEETKHHHLKTTDYASHKMPKESAKIFRLNRIING